MRYTVTGALGEDVAKRALWLAWQACGRPLGRGLWQDNPKATEEDVWKNACGNGDYGGGSFVGARRNKLGEVHGDYVFGRMMKIDMMFVGATVGANRGPIRSDYQAWCRKYSSYSALLEAAALDLGATLQEEG